MGFELTGSVRRFSWMALGCALVLLAASCGGDDVLPLPTDGGPSPDAAPDDAGPADAGRDAGPADLGPPCLDADGDGHADVACGGDDCDDADPNRYPGATEVCDADDEDCDDTTFGADGDVDGDGYAAATCCNGMRCGDDCDDALNTVNPRAAEQCNGGLDDDCDGLADAAEGVCRPCPPGYDGFDGVCTDLDECATPGFCGVGAVACANTEGSFVCVCGPGYGVPRGMEVGSLCTNVDECAAATNPCGAGTCTDNAGSYACACPMGYRGVSVPTISCVDVDECFERTAGCDDAPLATCSNTVGGFTCSCPGGYEGDGRGASGCTDVDECALGTDDCDAVPAATCTNTVGDFACACPADYVGSGRGDGGCLFDRPALSGLAIGPGATLSPTFAVDRLVYSLSVPSGTELVAITPEIADPLRSTLRIDGAAFPSGATFMVAPPVGYVPRLVTIVVTSESGSMRSYTVAVSRASAYVKASNPDPSDLFGGSVALSADGSTLAVGSGGESSSATGIDGAQEDDSTTNAGAVYVFRKSGTAWSQQAFVKASNTGASDGFGGSLSLSADGSVLAVGARLESSDAVGVGGIQASEAAPASGAVYVFRRTAEVWAQEAYVKASNVDAGDYFGGSVSLSADGAVLAVGAVYESSAARGIDGDSTDDTSFQAGAVYVFRRTDGVWGQDAYVKASNPGVNDAFGAAVSLSGDGTALAVGAPYEDAAAVGIGGDGSSNAAMGSGATYVFRRSAGGWAQEAYVKASNTGNDDWFGSAVALSEDGSVLVVGASQEGSAATGIDGDGSSNGALRSGAAYVFRRVAGTWAQEAYVKASNTGGVATSIVRGDRFGSALSLSADGTVLAVGAANEDSSATGLGGDQASNAAPESGAVYVFRRGADAWSQVSYVKASNTNGGDVFGTSVALSADGSSLAVGAPFEDSASSGIDGDQASNALLASGAVYLF